LFKRLFGSLSADEERGRFRLLMDRKEPTVALGVI